MVIRKWCQAQFPSLLLAALALADAWTVAGRVARPDGEPVPGARVVVALREKHGEAVESLTWTAAGADGRFAIDVSFLREERADDLLSRVIDVRAAAPRHDGFGDRARKAIEPPRATSADLRADLELAPAHTVRGRVLLPDGSPAGDAIVELLARFEAPGPPHRHSTAEAIGSTAPDGSFVLGLPRAGEFLLRAQKAGAGLAIRRGVTLDSSGDETVPDLALESGPAIEGYVVAPDGVAPAEGVTVRAKRLKSGLDALLRDLVSPFARTSRHDVPPWFHAPSLGFGEDARARGGLATSSATSGPGGRFVLRGLAPGEYAIAAGDDDAAASAATGDRDVRVALTGHWIRVRVRDAAGRARPGVELVVAPSRTGDWTERYVTSAPSGVAMVPTYRGCGQGVTAAPREFETASAEWKVDGSRAILDVEVVLVPLSPGGPRGGLRIRIVDERGAAVPRARGRIESRDRRFDAPVEFTCDGDGTALVSGLHTGSHSVEVDPTPAFAAGASASTEVEPGAATELKLVLR